MNSNAFAGQGTVGTIGALGQGKWSEEGEEEEEKLSGHVEPGYFWCWN